VKSSALMAPSPSLSASLGLLERRAHGGEEADDLLDLDDALALLVHLAHAQAGEHLRVEGLDEQPREIGSELHPFGTPRSMQCDLVRAALGEPGQRGLGDVGPRDERHLAPERQVERAVGADAVAGAEQELGRRCVPQRGGGAHPCRSPRAGLGIGSAATVIRMNQQHVGPGR
jgi:hypothetical protein